MMVPQGKTRCGAEIFRREGDRNARNEQSQGLSRALEDTRVHERAATKIAARACANGVGFDEKTMPSTRMPPIASHRSTT